MSLGRSCPGVRSRFLETPRTPCGGVFLALAQTASQSAVPGASTPRGWRRSEAVDVDRGQLLGRRLKDVPLIMDLHELAPVGRRATTARHRRRFERFAEVCQYLTSRGRSHPGLRPLANIRFEVSRLLPAVCSEPDVTASRWARKRKLLPHPGHEFRPGNSRGVVRAGLCMSVAAAFHGMSADSPAGGLPAGGPSGGCCRKGRRRGPKYPPKSRHIP